MKKKKVETIENRWDILYKDYPEAYDEFANVEKLGSTIKSIHKMFNLKDKVILDVGSGTGLSTFDLAKYAKFVIGIEPEKAMRRIALTNAKRRKIKNVRFLKGMAEKIPLEDNSIDAAVAVTSCPYKKAKIKQFIKEAIRVVKKGGFIATVDVAPKWYGGELAPIILGEKRVTKEDTEGVVDKVLSDLYFKHKDVFIISKYGSLKKILATYGFIFGRKAIDYIKKHKKTSIKEKFRIHYKKV